MFQTTFYRSLMSIAYGFVALIMAIAGIGELQAADWGASAFWSFFALVVLDAGFIRPKAANPAP